MYVLSRAETHHIHSQHILGAFGVDVTICSVASLRHIQQFNSGRIRAHTTKVFRFSDLQSSVYVASLKCFVVPTIR